MGVFAIFIFAFLASIYLIGESEERDLKTYFQKTGFILNLLVLFMAGVVFVAANADASDLLAFFS